MERIAILGVGLIGGSLGLAWKKHRPDLHIVGFDRPDVLETARTLEVIDEGTSSLDEAVGDADVVVIATPIQTILHLLQEAAPFLKAGAILTDVGSVKAPIAQHAQEHLPAHVTFIPGHPMAGSEKGGVAHAQALLFENATYVLCPPEGIDHSAFIQQQASFISLIKATGARVLLLGAHQHDGIAATVSHLPQLLAVALMNTAGIAQKNDDNVLRLAAGGFRDMTRIAASPFPMWRDILATNHEAILHHLSDLQRRLATLQERLGKHDLEAIQTDFDEAKRLRDTVPKDTKGFLHPLADVYVYAEDKPGVLFFITQTVYEAGINIKDIELLKIREGTGGAFRIGFSHRHEADAAIAALTAKGYIAYRL